MILPDINPPVLIRASGPVTVTSLCVCSRINKSKSRYKDVQSCTYWSLQEINGRVADGKFCQSCDADEDEDFSLSAVVNGGDHLWNTVQSVLSLKEIERLWRRTRNQEKYEKGEIMRDSGKGVDHMLLLSACLWDDVCCSNEVDRLSSVCRLLKQINYTAETWFWHPAGRFPSWTELKRFHLATRLNIIGQN